MKSLFLVLLLLPYLSVSAQNRFTISGQITDENHKAVNGATIFIGGTQLATISNPDGKFEIITPDEGSYHLLVTMMGYAPFSEDLMLTDKSVYLDITLKVKPIQLNQVNIGSIKSGKNRDKYLAVFKKGFIGTSDNARGCEILNPDIINFSTREGQLYADADDFLIIENKRLGYRVKYLLLTFRHKQNTVNTAYNGDAVFEELPGTDAQKQEWAKNRLDAYRGSMMHFFRSVFNNKALAEGFIANQMYDQFGNRHHAEELINFSTLVTAVDTSFISLKFNDLYITYNPKKAIRILKQSQKSGVAVGNITVPAKIRVYESELLMPPKKEAIMDARGSISSGYFLTFLILGDWIKMRVGDQLPFEYQPPVNPLPSK